MLQHIPKDIYPIIVSHVAAPELQACARSGRSLFELVNCGLDLRMCDLVRELECAAARLAEPYLNARILIDIVEMEFKEGFDDSDPFMSIVGENMDLHKKPIYTIDPLTASNDILCIDYMKIITDHTYIEYDVRILFNTEFEKLDSLKKIDLLHQSMAAYENNCATIRRTLMKIASICRLKKLYK